MEVRFRLGCSSVVVLLILLQFTPTAHCCAECPEDVSRTPGTNRELINRHNERTTRKITSPIGRILPEIATKAKPHDSGNVYDSSQTRSKRDVAHVRVKRGAKSVKEARLPKDKRSLNDRKSEKFASKSNEKEPVDRKAGLHGPSSREMRGASNYAAEIEEQPVARAGGRFKRRDPRGRHEDPESFADQDERSSLYDDFESKDVVKRGISGAEDYEEADEEEDDSSEMLDENAAFQEEDSVDEEEAETSKGRGDARVKRDQNAGPKLESQSENGEVGKDSFGRSDGNTNLGDESAKKRDAKSNDNEKDAETIENRISGKDEKSLSDRTSRENAAENEAKVSKVSSDRELENPKQSSISDDRLNVESPKPNEEYPNVDGDLRKPEDIDSSSDKKIVAEFSGPNGPSKIEESKVSETSNPADGPKIEETIIVKEVAIPSDAVKGLVPEDDYEKHVEEQIQRKIDAIKEEIKREIEEKQRIREIEENNERFDELRNQEGEEEKEEEDEEQSFEGGQRPEELRDASKGPSTNEGNNRATSRTKRQEKPDAEKDKNLIGSESSADRSAQPNHETIRKRSAPGYEATAEVSKKISSFSSPVKKREYARQVILVRDDQGGGRKRRRRRRRSRSPAQTREQVEEKLAAELAVDPGLRSVLGDGKPESESEASFLASEYREAFGGPQGETMGSRFKRIKRVLRG